MKLSPFWESDADDRYVCIVLKVCRVSLSYQAERDKFCCKLIFKVEKKGLVKGRIVKANCVCLGVI